MEKHRNIIISKISSNYFKGLITIESKYKYIENICLENDIDINIMTKNKFSEDKYKTKHLYNFAKSKYLVQYIESNILS